MAAENLLAMDRRFQAHVGEEGLGHRRQQRNLGVGATTLVGVIAVFGQVQLQGNIGGEGSPAFVQGFHGQQHAPHIRVHNNRVGNLPGSHRPCWCTALQTLAGVLDRVLIGALTQRQALDAHAQAFVVHHGEHGIQAFVQVTDQIARGAIEVHHAGG
ncbi:hypothetical protein D3C78_1208190 [compost metagenome]